jgi:ribosomal protein L18
MASRKQSLTRRSDRVRRQIKAVANGRPRLSVHRSSKNIYVQVIDDAAGRTLAAASTLDAGLRADLKTGADVAAAAAVGKLLRSARSRPASPKSFSTVVHSSITAASRPSPKQPAKAV